MSTTLSDTERTRLRAALADICATAGIDASGAGLVRYTMIAVYRLDPAGLVVRRPPAPPAAPARRGWCRSPTRSPRATYPPSA